MGKLPQWRLTGYRMRACEPFQVVVSQLDCRVGRTARQDAEKLLDVGTKDRCLVMKGNIREAELIETLSQERTSYVAARLVRSCGEEQIKQKESLLTAWVMSLLCIP